MKISFTDKILESDHPVFIVSNKASKIDSSILSVDRELINILKEFMRISRIQVPHLQLCLTEKKAIYLTLLSQNVG